MASTIKRHERLVALGREETLCKSAGSPLDPERRTDPAVTSWITSSESIRNARVLCDYLALARP